MTMKTAKEKFQNLTIGAKGAIVKECQTLLRKAGSSIQVTGEFAIGMVSAVRSFQAKNGLAVTGVIDAKTYAKLNEKPKKKTAKK